MPRAPRLIRLAVVAGLLAFSVAALGAEAPAANPYAKLSNEELAGVADEWEGLDQNQRRWFFSEVRKRLVAKERVPIRSRGRFGQVMRRPDAAAVRRQPEPADARGQDPNAYGLGFERRRELRPVSAHGAPEHSGLQSRP